MNQYETEKNFIDIVLNTAYYGAIRSMNSLLHDGPGRLKYSDEVINYCKWFSKLDENERNKVLQIIKDSVVRSVFNFLNILDNTGPYPVKNVASEYILNLQTYSSEEDFLSDKPNDVIRVNDPNSSVGDLHDLFLEILRDPDGGK
jgi:hypothetical protein